MFPVSNSDLNYVEQIEEIRRNINKNFKEDKESPLTAKDRANFTGFDFYPIDIAYRFRCKINKTVDSEVEIELETSKGDLRPFIGYGKVKFKIKDELQQLTIYKVKDQEYYFIPFMDATNSFESYRGGRYVTVMKKENDEFIIDFNLAYNPTCAYTDDANCVLVPFENRLSVPIEAGIKKFR